MKVVPLPNNRHLSWSQRPLVMGIINCTPDSFFADSRARSVAVAREASLRMISEGADLLDLGGESSRPGAEYVSVEQELERVVPVVEAIRGESDIPISVDTRKAAVARAAVEAGADLVNDISALRDDSDLRAYVAQQRLPVVLMHMLGTPRTMQQNPQYHDVAGEVAEELAGFAGDAERAGVSGDRIILDPGIGFGKRVSDNLRLLAELERLNALGYPVLVGVSRKAFLGTVATAAYGVNPDDLATPYAGAARPKRTAGERLAGTLAANIYAAAQGAAILRVHDVAETVDALKVTEAIHTVTRPR